MAQKWKVAFLCRENSCRSQISEALARRLASDVMEVYSAGVHPIHEIDPGAVRMLKQSRGIDMLADGQYPKQVDALPAVDVIVYMGCKVECARHPAKVSIGWNISDPKGLSEDAYGEAIDQIEQNILALRRDIVSGKINQWERDVGNLSLSNAFPCWNQLTPEQRERVEMGWRTEVFRKQTLVYETSNGGKGLMIVQKGCLRVYMVSEQGRELCLYRIYPGDVCVLSAACMMQELEFEISIEAEEGTEVITIPVENLNQMLPENPQLELFLYKKAAECFRRVMGTVYNVFFRNTHQKIAAYLLDAMHQQGSAALRLTHDRMARDLFSAREVVSKTLSDFSEAGILRVRRGWIEILDRDKLHNLIE